MQNNLFFSDNGNHRQEPRGIYAESLDDTLWHRRLGHLNRRGLKSLGLPYEAERCRHCLAGKATRKLLRRIEKKRSRQIGEMIHKNIARAVDTVTPEGYRYFQVPLDDFSHFVEVKLLRNENEAEDIVIEFIKSIKTNIDSKQRKFDATMAVNSGQEDSDNTVEQKALNSSIPNHIVRSKMGKLKE